jgi:hypothetical protein
MYLPLIHRIATFHQYGGILEKEDSLCLDAGWRSLGRQRGALVADSTKSRQDRV